jgi:hypothetical protein
MKWLALGLIALVAGCASSVPMDNPSSRGSFQPAAEERTEARALERAEADCATQGKHAVASRVEGETVYTCVASQ